MNCYRERIVVQDNTTTMTELIRVNVTDGDEPNTPRSQVTLMITAGNDMGLFGVSNYAIVTQNSLDGHMGEYIVTIVAEDAGSPQQSSTAMFTIIVVNTNENPPVFDIPSSGIDFTENSDASFTFTINDGDSGPEGVPMLPVISGEFASNFSITAGPTNNQFVLQTATPLDREEENNVMITLTVSDSGDAMFRRTATINVTINVIDDNDNSPVIENISPGMRISVAEASPSGHFIYQVNASDRDIGTNAELTFSIESATGGPNFPFTINNIGQINTSQEIADSAGTNFSANIIVTDGGSPMRSTSITVEIIVTETNNNKPVFGNLPSAVSINENIPVNDIVIRDFNVSDDDDGQAGVVSVELQQSDFFELTGSSVFLLQEVNYEVNK